MRLTGKVKGAIVVLGILALPVASPIAAQIDLGEVHRDPVEMLLDLHRQLDLTRSQISALRQIQRELTAVNRPLIREIAAVQREVRTELIRDTSSDERQREPSESQLEAARAPMEAIRRNNLAAMERVNAQLTELQKKRASVLLRIPERARDRRPDSRRHE